MMLGWDTVMEDGGLMGWLTHEILGLLYLVLYALRVEGGAMK